MNTTFTEGPWTAVQICAPMSRSKDGLVWGIVAVNPMRGRIDSQLEGISKPNAQLIAAAPEMYEALKAIDDSWSAEGWTPENAKATTQFTDDTIERWRMIRSALAKARGEA